MPDDALTDALCRMGLVNPGETVRFVPLTGGVSSDILLVETPGRRFCVKRALARLKVSAVWEAPVGRNAAEAAWMREVGAWLPHAVPQVLGEDAGLGLFAMSFLPPEDNPVWKAELLAGRADAAFAAAVGRDLGLIHARSAADPSIAVRFANEATFEAIRIEPYLRATGRAHPDLAARFEALAAVTLASRHALVHGDVSPKNILVGSIPVGGQGPVFLDAECACHGDPAFDLAFCLNHLLLKGARAGMRRDLYFDAFSVLADAYRRQIDWEAPLALEARAAALLPALFLARVDGKSPVEYLTAEAEREAVRRFARPRIAKPPSRLIDIATAWMHPT
ncbi:phosphotransferase family protein [Labrys monachus]|uniref:Aminoglycoside phosphotransferase (APT) family kinase protein n=1 Tax=Labrys monachus TaxID=217067 RepID=A0ABU0FK63_9HYPH|nr:aminoglycoside phosphotransferase family protein [Labrys monachus]MDQ0395008.1 aminoglycoside phosphotransferase (APT) family kinase protein [Labrys monachus]